MLLTSLCGVGYHSQELLRILHYGFTFEVKVFYLNTINAYFKI